MIQATDLISRDGKILWDCALNVPPGEEGEIIFDEKEKTTSRNQEKVPFPFCSGPKLPKMSHFSNKENFRAYRIWNLGWQEGDIELIM